MTKDKIIEKLFDDNLELNKEEIIFIARNLNDENKKHIPYDHTCKKTHKACGVDKDDAEELNKIFSKEVERAENPSISEVVEMIEAAVIGNEKFIRLLILQSVVMAKEKATSNSLESIIMEILRKKGKE